MTRLPAKGTTFGAPVKSEAELECLLAELHAGVCDVAEVHGKLGFVIGKWLSEQRKIEVSTLAGALLSTAKKLDDVSEVLRGLEEGLVSNLDIAVASELAKYLALEPSVGLKPRQIISEFRQDASRMAHVCMIAYRGLPDEGGLRGRPALKWHDEFTALLLEIANRANIDPTFWKDRVNQQRSGWLLEAAEGLETFLPENMRSPSREARGKRLDRSLHALRMESKTQK